MHLVNYSAEGIVSFVTTVFSVYVAFDLARQVRTRNRQLGWVWGAVGALVVGSGMWTAQFFEINAIYQRSDIGVRRNFVVLSWVAAVASVGFALRVAVAPKLELKNLILGSTLMGSGLIATHLLRLASVGIEFNASGGYALLATSGSLFFLASTMTILLSRAFQSVKRERKIAAQFSSSLFIGVLICGATYLGFWASANEQSLDCQGCTSYEATDFKVVLLVGTAMLLVNMLVTSALDGRQRVAAFRLNQSLKETNYRLQLANNELQQRAVTDVLTGLPNRVFFEQNLDKELSRLSRDREADEARGRVGVLFVDLDGFKLVNDSFGHSIGDAVLKIASERLLQQARDSDIVARVGGDEFLMLLRNMRSVEDSGAFAQRILTTLSQPFVVGSTVIHISCSIGIVVLPDHGAADKVVPNADAAMYAAKRAGRGRYAFYEPHMDSLAAEQMEMRSDLVRSIERDELQLFYQPKIKSNNGELSGWEALLRWQTPKRGSVRPDLFIDLAERFGVICQLGDWVLNEACRQMAVWAKDGYLAKVAINLSAHQLRDRHLVDNIAKALELNQLASSQLICEITESVAMADVVATQRTIAGLVALGVTLAIDDFGTGYSSLAYLRKLRAQQIKIDRSFILDLESSDEARAVVKAVVSLAHALGLTVVAEGVETEGQRNILIASGCDELQGYFYAKPLPADQILSWLKK